MPVIPKTTSPLSKFIRTGEGILVFAFNLAMVIVPIVSNALTPADAVMWAAILNGVAVVSRTGLKIVGLVQGATGIEPQQFDPKVAVDVEQLAAEIVTQLPADLGGKASPEQIADQAAHDLPTVENLVTDAEEFTSIPATTANAPTPSAVTVANGAGQAE